MASELSPEARELALVGKLELRIGLASSDKKLEDILKLYLAPLLLKLGSQSVDVRNKVRPFHTIYIHSISTLSNWVLAWLLRSSVRTS